MRTFNPLDLIDFPYAFSQRDLLSSSEFVDEAKNRGVDLDIGQLEVLQRIGLLVPLYAASTARPPLRVSDGSGHAGYRQLREVGDLVDPRAEGFRAWRRFRRRPEGTYWEATREWLYSHYQLLALPQVRGLQRYLRPRLTREYEMRYGIRLPESARPITEQPSLDLVALLTRLEAVYLPGIVWRIVGRPPSANSDAWFRDHDAFRGSVDPTAILKEFGCSATDIQKMGEQLLLQTWFDDPVREWVDLMRHMRPDRWFELRNAALIAIDLRVAAELILSLYDDLVQLREAEPLPAPAYARHPLQERLNNQPLELDPVLTHYGLSPHPAVLVVAEGESDRLVLRATLDLLKVPATRAFVDIVSSGGNSQSYAALISSVAPEPGQELSGAILPRRPLTRILRVLDQEGSYRRPTALADEKRRIVTQLEGAWRLAGGPALAPAELESVVEVTTWGRLPMEFANFTDGELAHAISKLSADKPKVETAEVSRIRHTDRPGPLFKQLLTRRGLIGRGSGHWKVELALELVPVLARKIPKDAVRAKPRIAAIAVVRRALGLASRSPRGLSAFRKVGAGPA